jgi:enamine deaminase RidA (YjgF/YER057c/UK114 family)|tara:strand:- start:613 stop:996 length:384 start_codon:yes stop_codon:yes gene_type:complete
MNYQLNPRVISPPAANYSHGVLSTNPEKILHTSGVVPVGIDGSTPVTIRDQADLVWSNIIEILREAHLELTDIVSITTYVVSGNDLGEVMHSRDQQLGGHKPASTLVVVPELAKEEWKMEIAVVAIQ